MAARAAALTIALVMLLALPALPAVPQLGEFALEHIDAAWFAERPVIPRADATASLETIPPERVFVHNSQGPLPGLPAGYPPEFQFLLSHVGEGGPEPSVGVDSGGRIFFKVCCDGNNGDVLRSDDGGLTWVDATSPLADPNTNDPMLWLDPLTDRVYNNDLVFGNAPQGCSWSTWTQLQAATGAAPTAWEGANPRFCSNLEAGGFVDHQKVHTGPVPPGHALGAVPESGVVPQATYFAWNTGSVSRISMSLDGGTTFLPAVTMVQGTCSGGLHGRVRSMPDGTLLTPKRDCDNPLVLRSTNLNNWQSIDVGADVGSTAHRKNPDIAVDTGMNAYMFWPSGSADGVSAAEPTWFARSTDGGATWSTSSIRASPPNVLSTTFHAAVAGSPGRVAVMYYGNDHTAAAPDHVRLTRWHAYITFSLNALDPDPTWVTVQLDTESDPIQIGSISTNSHHSESGSRNLLDFNDLVIDRQGMVVAAYADGCTVANGCANSPTATSSSSRDNEGVAAILRVGPDLLV